MAKQKDQIKGPLVTFQNFQKCMKDVYINLIYSYFDKTFSTSSSGYDRKK